LGLPIELTISLLSIWLGVKDVAAVDSAYCHTLKREAWLGVFNSPSLVVSGIPHLASPPGYTQWLYNRNLKVDALAIGLPSRLDHTSYLAHCGGSVKRIQLQIIKMQFCWDADTLRIIIALEKELLVVLRSCCNLVALSMAGGVTDTFLEIVLQNCPLLQHLDLADCRYVTDSSAAYIAGLPHLGTLNLSGTDLSDTAMTELATKCAKTLEVLHVRDCFSVSGAGVDSILRGCSKLRKLCVCACDEVLFDVLLICNLTTLNVEYKFSPQFLKDIATHGAKLQHLGIISGTLAITDFDLLDERSFPCLRSLKVYNHIAPDCEESLVSALKTKFPSVLVQWDGHMFDYNLDVILSQS